MKYYCDCENDVSNTKNGSLAFQFLLSIWVLKAEVRPMHEKISLQLWIILSEVGAMNHRERSPLIFYFDISSINKNDVLITKCRC